MKVETLQALTSKVTSKIKANKFVPLTQFIGIKTNNGRLALCATDGSNHIKSETDIDMASGLDISVSSDLFTKLINALPPEMEISISIDDNNLNIFNESINYHIPAISDDSGLIKYPEIPEPPISEEFDLKKFSECYNKVQNSVDAQALVAYLAAIYVSDVMLGTNNYLLAKANSGNLFGQEVLLPLPLCELFLQLTGDKVRYYIAEGYITMFDPNTIIRGKLHEGISEYPVQGIKKLFDISFDSYAVMNTANMSSALDRVSLFISDFDDNALSIVTQENKLTISSIAKSGYEAIPYDSKEGTVDPVTVSLDVRLLTRVLKSFSTPTVNMAFGERQVVAHKDDIQVICAAIVDEG